MSDDPLSEDVSTWPSDPYELLDVGENVERRELRRAYTRLIRRFKPEHFPNQFQRLREAYDTITFHLQWRVPDEAYSSGDAEDGSDGSPPGGSASIIPREDSEDSAPGDRENDELAFSVEEDPAGTYRAAHQRTRQVREAWESAKQSQPEEALVQLESLRAQDDSDRDLLMREYWLLRSFPELRSNRTALDLLIEGVMRDGAYGPFVTLLNRELARSPELALDPSCMRLLGPEVHVEVLSDYLRRRWQVAAELQQWDVLFQDLAECRPRVSQWSEEIWARLLVSAIGCLAWSNDVRGRALLKTCYSELEAMHHVHLSIGSELDELELLMDVALDRHRWGHEAIARPSLVQLIADSRHQPYEQYRDSAASAMRWFAEEPFDALEILDDMQRRNAGVLTYLCEIITAYQYREHRYWSVGTDESRLRGAVARCLRKLIWATYGRMRCKLLEVCLRYGSTPEQVAQLLSDRKYRFELANGKSLADALQEDVPLQCVCQAHHVFWATE